LECERLRKYYQSALALQSLFNAAHLAAVQAGDLARARELSPRLFDSAAGAALAEQKLKVHGLGHHQQFHGAGSQF